MKLIHDEIVESISEIKGVVDVKEIFENPDKYGNVVSHIGFKYDYQDQFNHTKGAMTIHWHQNNVQVFIPEKGYFIVDKETHPIVMLLEREYELLK